MSLLMDALKKAEEAKRKEKEAAEQGSQADTGSKNPQEPPVKSGEDQHTSESEPVAGTEKSENPFKLSLEDEQQTTSDENDPEHTDTQVNANSPDSETTDSGPGDKTQSSNSNTISTTLQMNVLDYNALDESTSTDSEDAPTNIGENGDQAPDSSQENEATRSENPFKLSLEDESQSTDDAQASEPSSSVSTAQNNTEAGTSDAETGINESIKNDDPSHRPPDDRTVQMNILDFNSLELANAIDNQSTSADEDETIIQETSGDEFELADSPVNASEEEATLEAIEDLFGESEDTAKESDNNIAALGKPTQQPPEDSPPIDYEALMALKADNQQRAQKLFQGKQPVPKNRWLIPAITMLALIIIIIAGSWWYFWQTSGLSSETQFNIEDLKSDIAEQSEAIDTAPQEKVTDDLSPPDVSQDSELTSVTDTTVLASDAGVTPLPREEVNPTATGPDAPSPEPFSDNVPVTATTDSNIPVVDKTPPASTHTTVEPAVNDDSPIKIKKGLASSQTNKHLKNAWEAYQSGDYSMANKLYSMALKSEPMNRDALLGKAALAMLQNNANLAKQYYMKLLERDPNDPEAQAALVSLIGRQDPMTGISQINSLLEQYPKAPGLHFTLGNLYAMQLRWTDAQQSYFQAWSLDSNNPDYIYNLAISLDHLEKSTQALRFYQLAADLASTKKVNFSTSELQQRIQELISASR